MFLGKAQLLTTNRLSSGAVRNCVENLTRRIRHHTPPTAGSPQEYLIISRRCSPVVDFASARSQDSPVPLLGIGRRL